MNLKKIITICALTATGYSGYAQYAEDALRFSEFGQGSSARFKGLGNAQTSLGGDLSSISGNPAGLGMFTRSEFGFTADYSNSTVNALYLDQNSSAQKNKLGLNQLGGVFYTQTAREKGSDLKTGWLSFNFGIGYNKTNDFATTIDYAAKNPNSSYADYLADLANDDLNALDLPAGSIQDMAYKSYLIEYDDAGYFPITALNSQQHNLAYRTGSQSELNFAVGANYSNQIYVGASLGLSSFNYNVDRTFNESGLTLRATDFPVGSTFPADNPDYVNAHYDLMYQNFQKATGSGVNAKLGLIFKATDAIRLGMNFISPTFYTVKDDFSEFIETKYIKANGTPVPTYTNSEELYQTDYNLRTPYKLNGGASVIINKQGLLTGDVEFVDYSSIKFSSDNSSVEKSNNKNIMNNYKGAVNFRVGGEYKIASLMLRAGYNMTGSPYKNADFTSKTISGGLGYRKNNTYFDVTYQNFSQESENTPYVISPNYPDYSVTGPGETASLKNTRNNVFLTIGTRF